MKIQSIPNTNYEVNPNQRNLAGKPANTSFKGLGNFAKNAAVKTFQFTEKGGFFLEFLIVDTVSLIIPRILVGLNRDRDKTGKWNTQAGLEEAGREVLSGPSMNLIPMGLLALVTKIKPASHASRNTISKFTEHMKAIVEKTADPKELTDKKGLNKRLADELFDDAFGDYKLKEKAKYKEQFSDLLSNSVDTQKKGLNKEVFKHNVDQFEALVFEINNKNEINTPTISPKTVKGAPATELFEDFHNYSRDIVEKLTKTKSTAQRAKTSAIEFLEKAAKTRTSIKIASAITAFFAVGSFLLELPKVYQLSKLSPAAQSAKRAQESVEKEGGAK